MVAPSQSPVDRESPFGLDELFFSTTDRKGIIRSGNRVFARVSGYREADLLGQPHNIIRHPDMPRAVFKLLWDYLEAGKPIAAYVKNMAKDGSYYWVVATVACISGGYLSVRFKPSGPLFHPVQDLYRQLREIERPFDEAGDRKAGIAASTQHLLSSLTALGFADYDAFMTAMLPTELRSRALKVGEPKREIPPGKSRGPALERLLGDCSEIETFLTGLFGQIGDLGALQTNLEESSAFVLSLASEIRLTSRNASVAALRLEDAGKTLGVIASIMAQHSEETARLIKGLSGRIQNTSVTSRDVAFRVAAAKLQVEMATSFGRELGEHAVAAHTVSASIMALVETLSDGVKNAFSACEQLHRELTGLSSTLDELNKLLRTLNVVHITGKVEAARASTATTFDALFATIASELDRAHVTMHRFGRSISEISARSRSWVDARDGITKLLSDVSRTCRDIDADVTRAA